MVKRNPWITGATDEDLAAQYKFEVRVRDKVDRANRAVIEIWSVKRELAERLQAALDEIEGEIY